MSNLQSRSPQPLAASDLCRRCDPGQFKFRTTDDLEDLEHVLGQARAVNAIEFGVDGGAVGETLRRALRPETHGEKSVRRR